MANDKTMRRMIVGLSAMTFVVALVGQSVAGPSRRVVEAPYKTPVAGTYTSIARAYYYDCEEQIGCAIIEVEKKDRRVKLEVKDASGRPVHASIYTMPGGYHYLDFCGSTKGTIAVAPQTELLVHVATGTCDDGETVSTATTGVVRATFKTKR